MWEGETLKQVLFSCHKRRHSLDIFLDTSQDSKFDWQFCCHWPRFESCFVTYSPQRSPLCSLHGQNPVTSPYSSEHVVGCEAPGDRTGRTSDRRFDTGMAWRPCASAGGASVRHFVQTAIDSPAMNTGTASRLQMNKRTCSLVSTYYIYTHYLLFFSFFNFRIFEVDCGWCEFIYFSSSRWCCVRQRLHYFFQYKFNTI